MTKFKINTGRRLALTGLSLLCMALFSPSISPANAAQDVNFSELESRGLYTKSRDGALGRNLWTGSPRSALAKLIETMPANSKNPALRQLILGILLTRASAKKIDNDIKPESGRDLLTLRLNKLIEGGYYTQAHALYSQIEDAPYHENLAKAGILTFLYTGQKPLACLEVNIFHEDFPQSAFIQEFYQYCEDSLAADDESSDESKARAPLKKNADNILLSLIQDKDFRFPYTPKSFAKLTILEQAVLVGEGRVKTAHIKAATVQKIPPAHLPFLLEMQDLKRDARFLITLEGALWGVTPWGRLEDLYNAKELEDLEKFENAEKLEGEEKPEGEVSPQKSPKTLNAYFQMADKFGIGALVPFSDRIFKEKPEYFSREALSHGDILKLYRLLILSGHKIPESLIKMTEEKFQKAQKNKDKTALRTILSTSYLYGLKRTDSLKNKEAELGIWSEKDCKNGAPQKYIIENVDKPSLNVDNRLRIYENVFDLTCLSDYVMPTSYMWDSLKQASEDKNIAEIILLSIRLLHETSPKDIYPRLFQDVITNLNHVGLTDISKRLAVLAILGDIE